MAVVASRGASFVPYFLMDEHETAGAHRASGGAAVEAQLSLSVVIPTRNRPQYLARCLSALAQTALPLSDFEVVVVDDGGDCALDAIVAAGDGSMQVRLVRQPWAGPAQARNTGGLQARGHLLAFLDDDDGEPSPRWMEAMLAQHRCWPAAAIGGAINNARTGNLYAEASQALLDYLYDRSNPDRTDATFFASLNLAVPRDAFLAIGGFDTSYRMAAGEDRAFCRRWRASGRRLVAAPDAIVLHGSRLAFRSFIAQHIRYGRGARTFHRQSSAGERPFDSWTFYAGIIAAPFRQGRAHPAPIALLLLLSQVASLAGYVWEVVRARRG